MFSFSESYNATADRDTAVCVYPMSGQYEALQHFLYYGLLLFAVFARHQVWLVTGAVASALTYSGTAAIHSIILAAVSRNSLLDLDSFGTWAVVSAGCLIMLPVAEFSETLRESLARPVFKFWGTLVMIGVICSAVACLRKYPEETACRSLDGVLLTGPNHGNMSIFNCTYSCFSTSQPLRSPTEITVLMKRTLLGLRGKILIPTVIMTTGFGYYGGFIGFLISGRKRTKAELHKAIRDIESYLSSPESHRVIVVREPSGGNPRQLAREEMRRLQEELRTGKYQPDPCLAFVGALGPLFFFVVVCLNEICIFAGGGLPFNEPAYAVGQWSGCVSIILVLIASAITQVYLPTWKERQEILLKEQAAREAAAAQGQAAQQRQHQQGNTANTGP